MRYQQYLRERYRVLLGYMGGIWLIVAMTILSPLLVLPFYPDELTYAPAFLATGIPLGIIGMGVRSYFGRKMEDEDSPTVHEGMVALVISWVIAIVVSAVPLMLLHELNFSQAIFESTSAWTTTGLSVVDVEAAPHIVLFYRSVMQLIGGAGFAIIVLSAITGPAGSGLSTAEGRDDKLAPNVRASSAIVIRMYVTFIALGFVGLWVAGMSPFDAVNHAFAALSTGGFSTRAASIGYWDSAAVEIVTIMLMLVGTINFMTAFVLFQGKVKAFFRNGEIQLLIGLLILGGVLVFFGVSVNEFETFGKQLRVAIFEVTSAVSTTGFSTVGYTGWADLGWLTLIIAMLIGGGSGSTAGGIKQFRIYVMFRALAFEIQRAFLPDSAVNEATIWKGDQRSVLTDKQIRRISLFVFMYMIIFFIGVLIVIAHGYPLRESMFEMASTFSTVGLSIGITSPDAPTSLLWTQSFGMLLGRLEFFALVIGIIKLFKDSYDMVKPVKQSSSA